MVSYYTFDITDNNISDSWGFKSMKHMSMWITCILLVFITYIWFCFKYILPPVSIEFAKHSTLIPSIYNCSFPFQCIICVSVPVVSLNVFVYSFFSFVLFFYALSLKFISSLPTFCWTKNPIMSKMKWEFFLLW